MIWNTQATSRILKILDGNRNDINLFKNYGQLITTNIQVQAKKISQLTQGRCRTMISCTTD